MGRLKVSFKWKFMKPHQQSNEIEFQLMPERARPYKMWGLTLLLDSMPQSNGGGGVGAGWTSASMETWLWGD